MVLAGHAEDLPHAARLAGLRGLMQRRPAAVAHLLHGAMEEYGPEEVSVALASSREHALTFSHLPTQIKGLLLFFSQHC